MVVIQVNLVEYQQEVAMAVKIPNSPTLINQKVIVVLVNKLLKKWLGRISLIRKKVILLGEIM